MNNYDVHYQDFIKRSPHIRQGREDGELLPLIENGRLEFEAALNGIPGLDASLSCFVNDGIAYRSHSVNGDIVYYFEDALHEGVLDKKLDILRRLIEKRMERHE
jgi:hypothetical protein